MPGRVLDASAVGALVFAEPDADRVEAVTTAAELLAPTLLPFEVASICRKKCRAAPEYRERFLSSLDRFAGMDMHYVEVDQVEATSLALQLAITTYDAAYVWLAIEHNGFLVPLDRDVANAAEGTSWGPSSPPKALSGLRSGLDSRCGGRDGFTTKDTKVGLGPPNACKS